MKIGRVINSIWSTRKDEGLVGIKLMVVQLMERPGEEDGKIIVAGDLIGAGIGEKVLITQGSSARFMGNLKHCPVDAVIVGIIDEGQHEAPRHA
jgi:ethanolamine utilization protein EutN